MEKGMMFTTDLAYAKQQLKSKRKGLNKMQPMIVSIEMIDSAFERTKAKKETYKNIVMFLSHIEVLNV